MYPNHQGNGRYNTYQHQQNHSRGGNQSYNQPTQRPGYPPQPHPLLDLPVPRLNISHRNDHFNPGTGNNLVRNVPNNYQPLGSYNNLHGNDQRQYGNAWSNQSYTNPVCNNTVLNNQLFSNVGNTQVSPNPGFAYNDSYRNLGCQQNYSNTNRSSMLPTRLMNQTTPLMNQTTPLMNQTTQRTQLGFLHTLFMAQEQKISSGCRSRGHIRPLLQTPTVSSDRTKTYQNMRERTIEQENKSCIVHQPSEISKNENSEIIKARSTQIDGSVEHDPAGKVNSDKKTSAPPNNHSRNQNLIYCDKTKNPPKEISHHKQSNLIYCSTASNIPSAAVTESEDANDTTGNGQNIFVSNDVGDSTHEKAQSVDSLLNKCGTALTLEPQVKAVNATGERPSDIALSSTQRLLSVSKSCIGIDDSQINFCVDQPDVEVRKFKDKKDTYISENEIVTLKTSSIPDVDCENVQDLNNTSNEPKTAKDKNGYAIDANSSLRINPPNKNVPVERENIKNDFISVKSSEIKHKNDSVITKNLLEIDLDSPNKGGNLDSNLLVCKKTESIKDKDGNINIEESNSFSTDGLKRAASTESDSCDEFGIRRFETSTDTIEGYDRVGTGKNTLNQPLKYSPSSHACTQPTSIKRPLPNPNKKVLAESISTPGIIASNSSSSQQDLVQSQPEATSFSNIGFPEILNDKIKQISIKATSDASSSKGDLNTISEQVLLTSIFTNSEFLEKSVQERENDEPLSVVSNTETKGTLTKISVNSEANTKFSMIELEDNFKIEIQHLTSTTTPDTKYEDHGTQKERPRTADIPSKVVRDCSNTQNLSATTCHNNNNIYSKPSDYESPHKSEKSKDFVHKTDTDREIFDNKHTGIATEDLLESDSKTKSEINHFDVGDKIYSQKQRTMSQNSWKLQLDIMNVRKEKSPVKIHVANTGNTSDISAFNIPKNTTNSYAKNLELGNCGNSAVSKFSSLENSLSGLECSIDATSLKSSSNDGEVNNVAYLLDDIKLVDQKIDSVYSPSHPFKNLNSSSKNFSNKNSIATVEGSTEIMANPSFVLGNSSEIERIAANIAKKDETDKPSTSAKFNAEIIDLDELDVDFDFNEYVINEGLQEENKYWDDVLSSTSTNITNNKSSSSPAVASSLVHSVKSSSEKHTKGFRDSANVIEISDSDDDINIADGYCSKDGNSDVIVIEPTNINETASKSLDIIIIDDDENNDNSDLRMVHTLSSDEVTPAKSKKNCETETTHIPTYTTANCINTSVEESKASKGTSHTKDTVEASNEVIQVSFSSESNNLRSNEKIQDVELESFDQSSRKDNAAELIPSTFTDLKHDTVVNTKDSELDFDSDFAGDTTEKIIRDADVNNSIDNVDNSNIEETTKTDLHRLDNNKESETASANTPCDIATYSSDNNHNYCSRDDTKTSQIETKDAVVTNSGLKEHTFVMSGSEDACDFSETAVSCDTSSHSLSKNTDTLHTTDNTIDNMKTRNQIKNVIESENMEIKNEMENMEVDTVDIGDNSVCDSAGVPTVNSETSNHQNGNIVCSEMTDSDQRSSSENINSQMNSGGDIDKHVKKDACSNMLTPSSDIKEGDNNNDLDCYKEDRYPVELSNSAEKPGCGKSKADGLDVNDADDASITDEEIGGYFMQDSFIDDSQRSANVLSDDSSDDDLFAVDLPNLNKLGSRPAPSTPTKLLDRPLSLSALYSPTKDEEIPLVSVPTAAFKAAQDKEDNFYDLDALLETRKLEVQKEKEMDEMVDTLKACIDTGGVANFTAEETFEDLGEEHKERLEQWKIEESVIKDHHPGMIIFNKTLYRQLFNHTLTPAQCGFVLGNTFLEQQIPTLPQDMLVDMLSTGVFELCLTSFKSPHQMLDWILYIMSIHPSVLVVQKCCAILRDTLRHNQGSCGSWSPSVKHITKILVNYGCKCETLNSKYTLEQLRFTSSVNNNNKNSITGYYGIENMRYIIKIMTVAVRERSAWYPVNDLVTLINMVLTISLDKRLISECLITDIQICLSVMLDTVPEAKWSHVVSQLITSLPCLTTHHHNLVHLVEMFPCSARGITVQRRLALTILCSLLGCETDFNHFKPDVKLKELFGPMSYIKLKNNHDFYTISSYISLVDFSVGNETLKAVEKKDLSALVDMIRSRTGDVRESIAVLDRTLIKDMMVRLASKWTFILQNMGTKQSTLFNWAHSVGEESSQETMDTGGGSQ